MFFGVVGPCWELTSCPVVFSGKTLEDHGVGAMDEAEYELMAVGPSIPRRRPFPGFLGEFRLGILLGRYRVAD